MDCCGKKKKRYNSCDEEFPNVLGGCCDDGVECPDSCCLDIAIGTLKGAYIEAVARNPKLEKRLRCMLDKSLEYKDLLCVEGLIAAASFLKNLIDINPANIDSNYVFNVLNDFMIDNYQFSFSDCINLIVEEDEG